MWRRREDQQEVGWLTAEQMVGTGIRKLVFDWQELVEMRLNLCLSFVVMLWMFVLYLCWWVVGSVGGVGDGGGCRAG